MYATGIAATAGGGTSATFAGNGLGTALLQRAGQLAAAQGSRLWLSVNAENNKAMQFYQKHQYQQCGEIFFDLGETRHKNWIMLQTPDTA